MSRKESVPFAATVSVDRSAVHEAAENIRSFMRPAIVKIPIPPAYLKTKIGRILKKRHMNLAELKRRIDAKYPDAKVRLSDVSNFVHGRQSKIGTMRRDAIRNYCRMVKLIPPAHKRRPPRICKCPRCGARHTKKLE